MSKHKRITHAAYLDSRYVDRGDNQRRKLLNDYADRETKSMVREFVYEEERV